MYIVVVASEMRVYTTLIAHFITIAYLVPSLCFYIVSTPSKTYPLTPPLPPSQTDASQVGASKKAEKGSAGNAMNNQDQQEVSEMIKISEGSSPVLANNTHGSDNMITSSLKKNGVNVVDKTLEGAELFLDAGETVYELVKAGGDDEDLQTMIQDAASVIGTTASILFPALLNLAEAAPFVGPVAKIALYFYGSVKSYLENKEDLEDLAGEVQDSLVWFKQTGPCITMLSPEHITQLKGYLSKLVAAIAEAIKMMREWKKRWTASKLLLSSQDKNSIRRLAQEVEKARNDISLHSTSVLFQMVMLAQTTKGQQQDLRELRRLVGEVETSFRTDIDIHLSRFLPGSRNWMHAVSCVYYLSNVCSLCMSG